jgi:uncharacterized protein (DUF58 family)
VGFAVLGVIVLILAGAFAGAGGLILTGVLAGLVLVVQSLWSRFGLRALTYERHVSAPRVRWGHTLDLDLVVRNAKALPLPWLQIDDVVTAGADIGGRQLPPSPHRGFAVLRSLWSVGWFERVTRRVSIVGSRRGTYRFTTAELRVADLFGRGSRTDERSIETVYRVIPRIIGVRSAMEQSPSAGASRAIAGLVEEPSLFAGVRPYEPGDHPRRIHWKATARLGRPVSRRFDAARERAVLLALDIQTLPGPSWMLNWDDELVEGVCVAALSLSRSWIGDGIAVGLAVNAFTDRPQRSVFLVPSAAPRQIAAIADLLAAASSYPSIPYVALLGDLARRTPQGCSIVALSCRDPVEFAPILRRLANHGFRASHASFGPRATDWSGRARALGLISVAYRLEPDWETADALVRVG